MRDEQQLIQFEPHTISVIKAVGDYTRLTLISGKSYLMRQRLTQWEKLLPLNIFYRVDLVKVDWLPRRKMPVTMLGLNQPEELARRASVRLTQRLKKRSIL